jgi:hypothetical protein
MVILYEIKLIITNRNECKQAVKAYPTTGCGQLLQQIQVPVQAEANPHQTQQ